MARPEDREGGGPARATVARASCPEPFTASNKSSPAVAPRLVWALSCTHIAWIAGLFSLVLGGLLVVNSFHIYQNPEVGRMSLVEARELLPLKTALRENPQNEDLKQQIRQLDQRLRHEYFRRENLTRRGGLILLGSAALCIIAMQLGCHLRRPPVPVPQLSLHREDPVRTTAAAAKAATGTVLALAGLTLTFVWNTAMQWQGGPTDSPPVATTPAIASIDPGWFPSTDEITNNWPYFRGPAGAGITRLPGLPELWDGPTGKNVLWKSAIDLPGENSPVVWGGHVYLTGATGKRRELYCYDAATGARLWNAPVSTPQSLRAEPPEVMEDTGFAAPTAATDGRRVFAVFANGDIAGFTADGKPLWTRALGTPENTYGHATSLTLWQNRVIVVLDQADAKAGKSSIMALDATTGESVWSTPRPVANSWVSPILIKHQGREQIITSADPWVIAYDPATGKALWQAKCMRGDVASSPVYANDLVYVACDQTIAAINPDGSGDVTDSKIAWRQEESGLPDLCSLLCDGPRVYSLAFGIFHAFDALTGEHLWEYDPKAKFQASPTLVNGRIHLLTDNGLTIIGEAGKDGFKEITRAALGEGAGASPAFAPGRIYLRGKKNLFCIGTKDGK